MYGGPESSLSFRKHTEIDKNSNKYRNAASSTDEDRNRTAEKLFSGTLKSFQHGWEVLVVAHEVTEVGFSSDFSFFGGRTSVSQPWVNRGQ